MSDFEKDIARQIASVPDNRPLISATRSFLQETIAARYSYGFHWLGRPIIQYPQDIMAMQELIWKLRPDVIVETGIAHGGSLIFSASMLAMLDLCDATEAGTTLDTRRPGRRVVAVDIDIRQHNRAAIEAHPLSNRIAMFQGSSIDPEVVEKVRQAVGDAASVLVCLDSNHSHDHVLEELKIYAPMTSVGSYCVVFDTVVEDLPAELSFGRPWGPGNSPKTAVHEYLRTRSDFKIDRDIDHRILLSVAPDGYLQRIK